MKDRGGYPYLGVEAKEWWSISWIDSRASVHLISEPLTLQGYLAHKKQHSPRTLQ